MEYTVNSLHGNAGEKLSEHLFTLLVDEREAPVVLCVGSDKITGDCLGPLIGHLLTVRHRVPAFVYGTMRAPVTAKNVEQASAFIRRAHPNAPVLAVDAALSSPSDIGLIRLRSVGLKPGSAFERGLPCVGDYSITAVVNSGGRNNERLFSTALGRVIPLAEAIAEGINSAISRRFSQRVALGCSLAPARASSPHG